MRRHFRTLPVLRARCALPALVVCACTLQACVMEGSRPPLQSADPRVQIDEANGLVRIDEKVPTSAAACSPGQLLRRGENGWECWTPPPYSSAGHAHDSSEITDFATRARDAMGARADANPLHHDRYTDAEAVAAMGSKADTNPLHHDRYTDAEAVAAMGARANTNPLHHDRYTDAEAVAAVTSAGLPWSSVTGRPATWPGTVAWTSVTDRPATYAPAAHVHALADVADVTADKAWPGKVPWSSVTGAPATWAPSAHQHPFAEVNVAATTAWPGRVAWAQVTGAPADLAALAAEVATLKQQLGSVMTNTLMRAEKTGAHFGECLTITHNWNTRDVGYTAWTTTADGVWVPVPPGYESGGTNLALAQPASASSSVSGTNPGMAVDGNADVQWVANSIRTGWVQVDLGAVRSVASVRIVPADRQANAGSYSSTSWDIQLSPDGITFGAAVASGACSVGINCASEFTHTLPAGASARFVRFNARSCAPVPAFPSCSATLAEMSVFSTQYAVAQPDKNTVRLCNYAGSPSDSTTRDLALLIWR